MKEKYLLNNKLAKVYTVIVLIIISTYILLVSYSIIYKDADVFGAILFFSILFGAMLFAWFTHIIFRHVYDSIEFSEQVIIRGFFSKKVFELPDIIEFRIKNDTNEIQFIARDKQNKIVRINMHQTYELRRSIEEFMDVHNYSNEY